MVELLNRAALGAPVGGRIVLLQADHGAHLGDAASRSSDVEERAGGRRLGGSQLDNGAQHPGHGQQEERAASAWGECAHHGHAPVKMSSGSNAETIG